MEKIHSKLARCESKTVPILEIKDFAFILRSIKQRAFFLLAQYSVK